MNGMTTSIPARLAYDVFNGDADGICALHQLRLAHPSDAVLVTGVKRDVSLLKKVPCRNNIDAVVLDVSVDANADALRDMIDTGAHVTYFDHHSAQQAFKHPQLQLIWDDAPNVCTSILVDRYLQGQFRPWAVTAAFGDNLPMIGHELASDLGLKEGATRALAELGLMLNYNAYGESVDDLHIAPCALYRAVHRFADPFDFIDAAPEYRVLCGGYLEDAARMDDLRPSWQSEIGAVYILPSTPWARRISGIFANQLVSPGCTRSYAVLTEMPNGAYVVSVRSGQPDRYSANGLCARFPTGGGRKAAAGINCLPAGELDNFIQSFSEYFAGVPVVAGEMHVA